MLVKKIVDNFLIKKEGKSILKDISKKNLIRDGIIDSLDLLTLASIIEKKNGKKKFLYLVQKFTINLIIILN